MKRTLVLALAAGATLFGATAAQAARVDWSVGINVPVAGGYVAPAYGYPAYAPPVVYAPRPRYVEPAPVYLAPPVLPLPRVRIWLPPLPFIGHDRWHQDDHDHWDRDRHDGRDGHVGWRR